MIFYIYTYIFFSPAFDSRWNCPLPQPLHSPTPTHHHPDTMSALPPNGFTLTMMKGVIVKFGDKTIRLVCAELNADKKSCMKDTWCFLPDHLRDKVQAVISTLLAYGASLDDIIQELDTMLTEYGFCVASAMQNVKTENGSVSESYSNWALLSWPSDNMSEEDRKAYEAYLDEDTPCHEECY